jgi:DNA-binding NarL/FixJ family response regulator
MSVRVLLADDHEYVRESVKAFLEQNGFTIVGMAQNGREAVQLAQQVHSDIAILDISMPLLDGFGAARRLREDLPRLKTIVLSTHDEAEYVLEAFRCGAQGYVCKAHAVSDLIPAIEAVRNGGRYVSANISNESLYATCS